MRGLDAVYMSFQYVGFLFTCTTVLYMAMYGSAILDMIAVLWTVCVKFLINKLVFLGKKKGIAHTWSSRFLFF